MTSTIRNLDFRIASLSGSRKRAKMIQTLRPLPMEMERIVVSVAFDDDHLVSHSTSEITLLPHVHAFDFCHCRSSKPFCAFFRRSFDRIEGVHYLFLFSKLLFRQKALSIVLAMLPSRTIPFQHFYHLPKDIGQHIFHYQLWTVSPPFVFFADESHQVVHASSQD